MSVKIAKLNAQIVKISGSEKDGSRLIGFCTNDEDEVEYEDDDDN